MLTRLAGGRLYDPVNGWHGAVRDLFVQNDRIVAEPDPDRRIDADIDLDGAVVMAGAIDIHSHIAGGSVTMARLMLPERDPPFPQGERANGSEAFRWTSDSTGRRYALMGFTTVVEPAMLPVNAAAAHLELNDIPIIDKAALTVLGNDAFLLGLLRDKAGAEAVRDYVGWTVRHTQALGVKTINAGGSEAFKQNVRAFSLDDEVPAYGLTSRQILQALLHAVQDLGIPHPLHVHCNNLGIPGNVTSATATMEAAEGLPIHLAHVQFYGYGDKGKRGISSAATQLFEALQKHPNVTADVGQVLFGPTVTISGDLVRQYNSSPAGTSKKWLMWEGSGGGGGIVPYRYRSKSFVNALQWAIGLELFLLFDDPWRLFFTTDHPNGAPFTTYPELFGLLMDKDRRAAWLDQVHPAVGKVTLLAQLSREYSLGEIAVMTRAAPAKLLGLDDRGHLGPGALADIAVYREQPDKAQMFAEAKLVLKSGQIVVRDGAVAAMPAGTTQVVRPTFDRAIESRLGAFTREFDDVALSTLKVPDEALSAKPHACRAA